MIIQGVKLRGVCSTSLQPSHLSIIFYSAWFFQKQFIQGVKLRGVCITSLQPSHLSIIFYSAWFFQKQFTLKRLSVILHALLTKLLQTAYRPG